MTNLFYTADDGSVGLNQHDYDQYRLGLLARLRERLLAFGKLGDQQTYEAWKFVDEAYKHLREFECTVEGGSGEEVLAARQRFRWRYFSDKSDVGQKKILTVYWHLQGKWHKHSDPYKKYNAQYMREYRAKAKKAKEEAAQNPQCGCGAALKKLKGKPGFRKLCDACLKLQRRSRRAA